MKSNQLLLEIARCPIVEAHFESQQNHPCREIVESQLVKSLSGFQLPEPWNGQIELAPILFLSSNPSIDPKENYPVWQTSDDIVEDFFSNRFNGLLDRWIRNGKYVLRTDGSYSKAVNFLSAVRKRAEELLQRDVIPGVDYALSEIVHCKSRQEIGVQSAMKFCSERYLKRIMSISGSIIIVILGDKAKEIFQEIFTFPESSFNNAVGINIMGKERYICFLPHPNARKKRTFKAIVSTDILSQLRGYLQKK
jgi:hypothetical protein